MYGSKTKLHVYMYLVNKFSLQRNENKRFYHKTTVMIQFFHLKSYWKLGLYPLGPRCNIQDSSVKYICVFLSVCLCTCFSSKERLSCLFTCRCICYITCRTRIIKCHFVSVFIVMKIHFVHFIKHLFLLFFHTIDRLNW